MKEKMKQQKAITLIALVITIIILLILTGVTLAVPKGNQGIINSAKEAKNAKQMSDLEEEIEVTLIKINQEHRTPTIEQITTEIEKIEHVTKVNKETGDIENDLGNPIKGKLNNYIEKASETN